jgi:hypothetical protein
MVKLLPTFRAKAALRLAAVTGLGLALSGCVYGYGEDAYYADGYGADQCDPYSEFDSYYDCDNRLGFVNIGFGGGWYDNYYYPGHGYYLFDRYGTRFNMHDNYRRYWAQQRYYHYQNYARGGYGRGRGHGYGYGNNYGHGGNGHNGHTYDNGHGQNYGHGGNHHGGRRGNNHGGDHGGQGSHDESGNQRQSGALGAILGNRARDRFNDRVGRGARQNDNDASAVPVTSGNSSFGRGSGAVRPQPVAQPSSPPIVRQAPPERAASDRPAAQPRNGSGLGQAARSILGRKNKD